MTRWWLRQSRTSVVAAAGLPISVIAVCDWRFVINATLGFLYIFPIAMLGTIMRSWQLLLVAVFLHVSVDKARFFSSKKCGCNRIGPLSITCFRSFVSRRSSSGSYCHGVLFHSEHLGGAGLA